MNSNGLNHFYRIVWNAAKGVWMAVSETAKGHGKSKSSKTAVAAAVSLLIGTQALAAGALPTGGTVTAGSGSIAQSGTTMTITQTTARMAADWQSFNIGQGNTVQFVQPSSTAVALNRVLGPDVSTIQGALKANGQVFLLNPNGVLFTPTAQVDVGGLVASTLNLKTDDFMAGRYIFESGSRNTDGGSGINNQGTIRAVGDGSGGGTVALIAAQITNTGTIQADKGSVLLGAGNKVTLDLGGPAKLMIEQGALDTLIANGGAIQADGGRVLLTAKAADALSRSVINNTGVIQAQTLATGQKGEILLLGDMQVGSAQVGGMLDASAPNGGNGGFIETSARKVQIADNARITTAAAMGISGSWLIDPEDFTVGDGGNITGAALSTALGLGDVTIQTVADPASCTGATCTASSPGNGDIFVTDAVSWNSASRLTLNAYRNITITNAITASHADGAVSLLYGQGAVASSNTAAVSFGLTALSFTGSINLQAKAVSGAASNLITKLGSDGAAKEYTVITALGAEGSTTGLDLQGVQATGNYALGANINAAAASVWNGRYGFDPIGTSSTALFTGTFNGLGHTISNLEINRSNETGFFGATGDGSDISNLGLSAVNIRGGDFLGGLVGLMQPGSSISNTFVTGVVASTNGGSVGGLVGRSNGSSTSGPVSTIRNSHTNVVLAADSTGGGLVGRSGGFIVDSSSDGSVTGAAGNDGFGGLVGTVGVATEITNSHSTANVSGRNGIGGLVGSAQRLLSINNSYATGNVNGYSGVGGLVGKFSRSVTIFNSHALGNVTGGGYGIGGLVGEDSRSTANTATEFVTVTDSYASGNVSSPGRGVGGLLGVTEPAGTVVTNSFYDLGSSVQFGDGNGNLIGGTEVTPYGIYTSQFNFWLNASKVMPSINAVAASGGLGTPDGSGYHTLDATNIGNLLGYAGVASSGYKFKLAADVALPAGFWIPDFKAAEIDGAGFKFTGLAINQPDNNNLGLIGSLGASSTVKNLGVSGTASGDFNVGGLVGNNGGHIIDSYATVAVTGADYSVGGLVGVNTGTASSITNSYATGAVSGGSYVGGLVGSNYGTVSSSHATGTVAGGDSTGGLVGWNSSGAVSSSYASGQVTGTNHGTGGLVGKNFLGTISNSYHTTGTVNGYASVGGLVGDNHGGSISTSYASSVVTGSYSNTGGLVGLNRQEGSTPSAISNSYATGAVSGADYGVGGLVGNNSGNSTISNSYAAGAVTGGGYKGGLAGENYGVVTNSFYDSTVNAGLTGFRTSDVAVLDVAGTVFGMSTADMKLQANFTSATAANGIVNPAWNFTPTTGNWAIDVAVNSGYPCLSWVCAGGGGSVAPPTPTPTPSPASIPTDTTPQDNAVAAAQGSLAVLTDSIGNGPAPIAPPGLQIGVANTQTQVTLTSGGLRFQEAPTDAQQLALDGARRDVSGLDPLGFMRVFVLRGGINFGNDDSRKKPN